MLCLLIFKRVVRLQSFPIRMNLCVLSELNMLVGILTNDGYSYMYHATPMV